MEPDRVEERSPQAIVAAGYDRVADAYLAWTGSRPSGYSLTHLPRTDLPDVLARIRSWLRPGGTFIASFGVEDDPGTVEDDWLGVPMYFSHFSARVNRRLVAEAGFEIERADALAEPADRHGARFLWIVARAPAEGAGATRRRARGASDSRRGRRS